MKNIKIYLLLSLSALTACGSTTSITGAYKDSASPKTIYKKVFVVAISDRAAARQTVENSIANLLSSRGAATVKSSDAMPPNFQSGNAANDKAAVLAKIKETGCDGIMTIALINKEHESRYVPGTANYYPMAGYYGGFGAYYAYGYNNFYSPGYYTDDKIYYLEANVYDAATEKMVWSAQSQTYNPTSLNDFLAGYTKALSDQMNKDGIMPAGAK